MELGKKKATIIGWAIILPLLAIMIGLNWTGYINSSWTVPLSMAIVIIASGIVAFIQKRIDPEAYKARLQEMEAEEKAEDEIRHIKIKRTWGGTICEFITAMLLIVSWILILKDFSSLANDGQAIKIAGLCTVGAIWFHATTYTHKMMGTASSTVKQLKMSIYRKRALGICCALFLICGFLIPDGNQVGEWFIIALGLAFVLLFGSKFVMGYVK